MTLARSIAPRRAGLFPRAVALVAFAALAVAASAQRAIRPPSVPLVAHDPYFSIWSPHDKLTDGVTTHWTGKVQNLRSLIRVDGRVFRLMGPDPASAPAMDQTALETLPTRSIYRFASPEVQVTLTFMSPLLPDDLDLLSRPVTYLTWQVRSADGKRHNVDVYYDNGAELAVNTPDQAVVWQRERVPGLLAMRVGTEEQPVLAKKGDDLRIDWGYDYVATVAAGARAAIAHGEDARNAFAQNGRLPGDVRSTPTAAAVAPVLAVALSFGAVGDQPVSRWVMLAYDDIKSINYFGRQLSPYWRRKGATAPDLLKTAAADYPALTQRCSDFDQRLVADLRKAGGDEYAQVCALLYRQCFAANKVVADGAGMPLIFPKENFSNGCIATVDILYPMGPQFLLFGPALTRAMLIPILDYAASPRWRFPFAPHDLGTYPKATGQVYGGGERTEENQMPVEESGNMLILVAALCRAENSPALADRYWKQLSQWAEFLKTNGLDPANQLCTDDFAGHLAHNVNLSLKAIEGLGAYAWLCDKTGHKPEAASYWQTAREYATAWQQMGNDGDHYRLAFDKAGTWSQKYNLVWDKPLGLNLFPPSVAQTEIAFYKTKLNRYGLPLDNRQPYTKLDWSVWTACLTDNDADFQQFISPIYAFLNDTMRRVPATDWYQTQRPDMVGFQARSVVGGAFIRLLQDPAIWSAWFARGQKLEGNWAPLPTPAELTAVVPTSQQNPVTWRYTFTRPAPDWFKPTFDDAAWQQGPGGFGTRETPGAIVRTVWSTPDIWLRREFDWPAGPVVAPRFLLHHDEDAEVYINGVLATKQSGFVSDYDEAPMTAAALKALRPGRNVFAVHCHQTTGGQYIDLGIYSPK